MATAMERIVEAYQDGRHATKVKALPPTLYPEVMYSAVYGNEMPDRPVKSLNEEEGILERTAYRIGSFFHSAF